MWRKRKHIVWLMPFDRPFGDTSGEHSQCASVWDTKWYDITIQSADLVKLRCSESALTICTYQICDVLLCMVCDVWCLIFGPIIVLLAFIFDYHMFHDSDMKYLYLPECVYIYIHMYMYTCYVRFDMLHICISNHHHLLSFSTRPVVRLRRKTASQVRSLVQRRIPNSPKHTGWGPSGMFVGL